MRVTISGVEFWAMFSPLLLALLALGGLVLDMSVWRQRPRAVGVFVFVGLIVILFVQFYLHVGRLNFKNSAAVAFQGELFFDVYSVYFNYLFLLAAAAGVLFSLLHFKDREEHRAEYYIILTIATAGMSLMAAAADLLMLFIGLEVMSISIYLLVAAEKKDARSGEASIKYLLLGAFASAIMVYGMALVFGMTGEINYRALSNTIGGIFDAKGPERFVLMLGIMMVLVGMFFKVAAVPFHMWTPDAYEGAPTPITAIMATGIKAAAFAALLRLAITALSSLWGLGNLYAVFYLLAIATMVLGNFVAIAQPNLKRMLAYSSIAHAGYLMVGMTAVMASGQFILIGDEGVAATQHAYQASSAILYYLLVYTLMNLPAFGVVTILGREKKGGETLEGFAGLAAKRPALAAVMAVCMLSLAGVPPLAGFTGKFYLFQAAVSNRLYILAVIGVLASVVSAYYYLRVIVVMYMQPEKSPLPATAGFSGAHVASILGATMVVLLGLFPQAVLDVINKAFDQGMINISFH